MEQRISYVPVFVDNTNYIRDTKMVRLTYFYVECTEPSADTYMKSDRSLPLLFIDFEGVIVSGLADKEHFDTPDEISELFDFIDEKDAYVVGVSYFWLPNELLRRYIETDLVRGDVLRVYTPLFLKACTQLKTPREIAIDDIPLDVQAVYLSEKETYAFKGWTDQAVDRVKKRYREQPEMNLRERLERKEG